MGNTVEGGCGLTELIVFRHGESTANAAFAIAEAAGSEETDLVGRDADITLSPVGQTQAAAIGRWLVALTPDRFPEVVLCSPYRRAADTLEIALTEVRSANRVVPEVVVDERLRDREAGVLELLTTAAVKARFPAELERHRRVGVLQYRPEGGESLADVGRRVGRLLNEVTDRHSGRRAMMVAHDAVVLMLRQIIEGLPDEDLLGIIAAGPVRNATLTRWLARSGRLELADYDTDVSGIAGEVTVPSGGG
jgi:2,3-bisphosphoglycerate-dependent phosphoglycerate mutase